ncbi:MAG TPA: nitrogen fixation protein NifQ [Rhodocyclaceae bacterium]|nr:nitrogen fixation protein NifQ [Rhodocyclaceae bacterium]
MNAMDRPAHRALLVAALLARPAAAPWRDDPNRPLFAQIIAGRQLGEGCLPRDLGLGAGPFAALCGAYFPGPSPWLTGEAAERIPEWEDIQRLLLAHRARQSGGELWMANIVATACAGRDHLWQDLGLAGRDQLSRLMIANFPHLARQNTGDMKWKKFIYKQFCADEGIYVCPAPSCGACADHAKCFGPES